MVILSTPVPTQAEKLQEEGKVREIEEDKLNWDVALGYRGATA